MRFKLVLAAALATAMAAPLTAQTIQQRFEAATAKLDAKDYAGALADFERLETELLARTKPPQQSLALVRARKAEVLAELGQASEARDAYRLALDGGALDADAVAKERDAARLRLARIEEATLDHAAAARTYLRFAEASTDPMARIVALASAARTQMFTDPAAALANIDRALALAEQAPAFDKADMATVVGTKGRILLNTGRGAEALDLLERAISLRGGLTLKADQWDVALRSDAAIAAIRLGKDEQARRYLAYTGAGRTEKQLSPPAESQLPDCADLDGFTPEDSVVVQFAILEGGRVAGAQPVLSTRSGAAPVEFARHVERWTWTPETAKQIDPFYRIATRVELRCTNSRARPPLTAELSSAFDAWLAANRVELSDDGDRSDASVVTDQRSRLESARKSGNVPLQVAYLLMLSQNATVDDQERLAMLREARSLVPAGAPSAIKVLIDMDRASIEAWRAQTSRGRSERYVRSMQTLLADPAVVQDPRLRAIVGLTLAKAAGDARQRDTERAAIRAVVEDKGLGERDPLKVGALSMLANVEASAGNLEAARAAYDRTGLTAEQCALIDGGPVLLRSGASSADFPMEAMRWGFEGWTQAEFDIAADGRTTNVRNVMTYPPAVFAKASRGILDDARFRATYRPGNDPGCSGASRRIRFSLPD